MEAGRKSSGDANWFEYDAFKNNCQAFVKHILSSLKVYGEAERTFAYQNIENLVKAQPSYLERVARTATDLGSIAERAIYGTGLPHGILRNVLRDVY